MSPETLHLLAETVLGVDALTVDQVRDAQRRIAGALPAGAARQVDGLADWAADRQVRRTGP